MMVGMVRCGVRLAAGARGAGERRGARRAAATESAAASRAGARCCAAAGRTGSSVQNTSPWLSSVGTPYRSTSTGSGSSLTPVRRANSSPSRKSRLPWMAYTGDAAGGQAREARAGARVVGIVVVVADPDLEQVAEQVERLGAARRAVEKGEECIDGPGGLAVEMQVGGEQAVATRRSLRRRCACGGGSAGRRRRLASAGGAAGGAGAGAGPARRRAPAAGRRVGEQLDLLDHHRLQGRVLLERTLRAGGRHADAIDDFHAFDHAPEHGVAPARGQRIEIARCRPRSRRTGSRRCAGPQARARPTVPRRFLSPLPASFGIGLSVGLAL